MGLPLAGDKLWFHTFGYVEVEEVAVQNSLNDAGNYSDPILEALTIVTVDPVKDVQSTVGAQSKQVMWCDRFSLSSLWNKVLINVSLKKKIIL